MSDEAKSEIASWLGIGMSTAFSLGIADLTLKQLRGLTKRKKKRKVKRKRK